MEFEEILEVVRHAANELAALPYGRVELLKDAPWFEERGVPGDHNFCQIEGEVLDFFEEGDVNVLHVILVVYYEDRELGTTLFFYSDGRPPWIGGIVEYVNGVSMPIVNASGAT